MLEGLDYAIYDVTMAVRAFSSHGPALLEYVAKRLRSPAATEIVHDLSVPLASSGATFSLQQVFPYFDYIDKRPRPSSGPSSSGMLRRQMLFSLRADPEQPPIGKASLTSRLFPPPPFRRCFGVIGVVHAFCHNSYCGVFLFPQTG